MAELNSQISRLYVKCKKEIFGKKISLRIASRLENSEKLIIFSSILSHNIAPYGGCNEGELFKLLKSDRMNCRTYTILAVQLFNIAVREYKGEIIFVGFDGGVIGNHTQIIFKNKKRSILLDPTVGIVAFVGYNSLLKGKRIKDDEIFYFYSGGELMYPYFQRMKNALLKGLYKPSDVLYYYVGLDNYLKVKITDVSSWPTPGAVSLRKRVSPLDFNLSEFKSYAEVISLCKAIDNDAYEGIERMSCEQTETYLIINWLNRILRVPHYYNSCAKKKKGLSLSRESKKLIDKTQNLRRLSWIHIPDDQREDFIRLNRLILEETYPKICPKSKK